MTISTFEWEVLGSHIFAMEIFITDGFHARRKDSHSWRIIVYFSKRNMVSLNNWAQVPYGNTVSQGKWAQFPPRKHVFLEQMGWSSLGQTLFPYCLGQTMLVKELWAHLPQEICKFPKENIGLQFSFSSENLLQPPFLFSWGNLAKEVGPNCTKIWELSPRKGTKVPQWKLSLILVLLKNYFSLSNLASEVEPSWMTPFFIWYLWSFHLKKSSV